MPSKHVPCRGSETLQQLVGRQMFMAVETPSTVLAVHFKPLMAHTIPENDDPVRTMTVASSKSKKSKNAFTAATSALLLCPVCMSEPSSPRSTKEASTPSLAAYMVQFRAILLLCDEDIIRVAGKDVRKRAEEITQCSRRYEMRAGTSHGKRGTRH